MIKNDKPTILDFISKNWHIIVALFTVILMVSKAYDMNNNQTSQINDLESRVLSLENHKNTEETNWAVLKVQLIMIQNDVNDIKNDLKEYKHGH